MHIRKEGQGIWEIIMPTALFLSPHLDDVAFSCAGTLLSLAASGWNICCCTVFAASVPNPQGFALRCQTDKSIAVETDYMALRRAEDWDWAQIAGVSDVRHWPFAEAPHRGYESAAALFAGVHAGDEVWKLIAEGLQDLTSLLDVTLVFAPQGLGNHADHLQVIAAVRDTVADDLVCWYRDTPYALREPDARPSPLLPGSLVEQAVSLSEDTLTRKIAGACAYRSQIGFQFGGPAETSRKLREFHRGEAARMGRAGYAETYLGYAVQPLTEQIP